MKIILTGLEEYGLDGEYDLDTHPTGREMNRFRKEAELSPSELTDAVSNGGLDIVRLYAYVALERANKQALASKVLDVPLDLLGGIEVEDDNLDDDVEEGEEQLPPTLGSESDENEPEGERPSGPTSPESSALPA